MKLTKKFWDERENLRARLMKHMCTHIDTIAREHRDDENVYRQQFYRAPCEKSVEN